MSDFGYTRGELDAMSLSPDRERGCHNKAEILDHYLECLADDTGMPCLVESDYDRKTGVFTVSLDDECGWMATVLLLPGEPIHWFIERLHRILIENEFLYLPNGENLR